MPRRVRRSGVRFIEDDRDRSLTFFKRRAGLFKTAADLSTLTGARVAVVLESENGRFSSFGTPEDGSIVDAFLSGNAPTESDNSEKQKATITNLQNELLQLEKDKAIEDKRKKESVTRIKEIQESSRMAKYVYGKEEDLDATELYEMCRELSRLQEEINHCLPALLREKQVEAGGQLRDPSLLQPSWWRSMPTQVVPPPKYSRWAPSEPSFQHPWMSSSRPVLERSGSSPPNLVMLPPSQLPPKPAPSMVRLQAPKMPLSMEAHPYNYHIRAIDIKSNYSHSFSQSPILPAPPLQPSSPQIPPLNESSPPLSPSLPFSLPLDLESQQVPFNAQNYNSMQPARKYAKAGSTSIPSNEPCYSSLPGLNVELGNTSGNGGQTGGGHNGFGLSSPLHGDGWAEVASGSTSAGAGESSAGGDAGNNLGGVNFPWY